MQQNRIFIAQVVNAYGVADYIVIIDVNDSPVAEFGLALPDWKRSSASDQPASPSPEIAHIMAHGWDAQVVREVLRQGPSELSRWLVRNYLVFGRLLLIKSNLAYELYQSQCLQPDGLIRGSTFSTHPWANAGRERQEYKQMGEIAFLEHKRQLFAQIIGENSAPASLGLSQSEIFGLFNLRTPKGAIKPAA